MNQPLNVTPETRNLWENYAQAKQRAEDTLLLRDGVAAAQAFYRFVEGFIPQTMGSNVVPLQLRRHQRGSP